MYIFVHTWASWRQPGATRPVVRSPLKQKGAGALKKIRKNVKKERKKEGKKERRGKGDKKCLY